MYGNFFNPYWWGPPIFPQQARVLPTLDRGGIYVLSTNGSEVTEASYDFGLNVCEYNALPCESIVLLNITSTTPAAAAELPVTIVAPSGGQSTVNASTSGTKKISVVDSQGTQITGTDVEGNTQRLAYINKRTGVIRFLEYTAVSTTPTP